MAEPTTNKVDPPHAADEVTMLRSFLDYYRITVRRQAEGLTQAQLATPLPPAAMTLGGMLKHLVIVEHWWFSTTLLGLPGDAPEHFGEVDWDADMDWDWHSAKDDTPEQLLGWYDAQLAESDRIIDEALRTGGLDTESAMASRHVGDKFTLRWILVHLIEEYARHAGHGDLIRESIDGLVDL